MAVRDTSIENPVTGQRLIFATGETAGESRRIEGVFKPSRLRGVDHIHPDQAERFEVVDGRLGLRVSGRESVLEAGETADVPAGTPHSCWNAADGETRVVFEFQPWNDATERFYELYFGFAQEGKVDSEGKPKLLDVATVWREMGKHGALASPPLPLQRLLFSILAPIARLLGRKPPAYKRTAP
jgi:quercetin dioxygenase-like cupin family protein